MEDVKVAFKILKDEKKSTGQLSIDKFPHGRQNGRFLMKGKTGCRRSHD
jgi:hypothetical protein